LSTLNRYLRPITLTVCVLGLALHGAAFAQAGHPGATDGSEADLFCSGAIQPPLEVQLEITSLVDLDGERGTAELRFSVTPRTDAVRVSWEIVTPEGLTAVAGNPGGIEPASRDAEISRSVTLAIPDGRRYSVYARAILETTRGELYTRAVSRTIDLGEPDIEHPAFVRTDPVRGAVTSYKGVVIEGGER
jgi:hypothetical protein